MHYELYVDSLFFLNFIMNLYLLILVNRSTFGAGSRRGRLWGPQAFCCHFLAEALAWGWPPPEQLQERQACSLRLFL